MLFVLFVHPSRLSLVALLAAMNAAKGDCGGITNIILYCICICFFGVWDIDLIMLHEWVSTKRTSGDYCPVSRLYTVCKLSHVARFWAGKLHLHFNVHVL